MKTKATPPPSSRPVRHQIHLLGQLLKYVPRSLVNAAAARHGAEAKARSFSVWSHLATMIFVQLAQVLSLNDVCDWLRIKSRAIAGLGMTPPSRNNLSHAHKERPAAFMEEVFWKTLEHLQRCEPDFGGRRKGRRLLHRFRVKIHAVDSTVMELVANCMDWAKHRRRKAAAKMHLRLDVGSFLPAFAIVDTAGENDNKRARKVCAGLADGEIVVFDRAYVDFAHLRELDERGVQWVTRAKSGMDYRVVRNLRVPPGGRILKDQIVVLSGTKWKKLPLFKGWQMRRVEAIVEVDGKDKVMVFLSNNLVWSAQSVCDLHRARWESEVFFKQVKQTLKLSGLVGYSANAIRWQVWTALLVDVRLRFAAHLSAWGHSFTGLFTVVRAALWERLDLLGVLRSDGTAGGSFGLLGAAHAAWLPGLEPGSS